MSITYYLLANSVLLCSLGVLMILSPSTLLNVVHSNSKHPYDMMAIMAGWGASTLTLGLVCLFMLRSNQYLSKKIVAMALFCGYTIFGWGSYIMVASPKNQWNTYAINVQIMVCIVLALASFWFGFVKRGPAF